MTVSNARRLARLFFACALSFHALVLADPKAIFPRSPYTGSPLPVPGRIEAEHYDLGGEGTGYHDTTPGNLGGSFRTDDVDLTGCGDAGCGYQVSWTDAGEWLEYTVNVAQTGVYRLTTRYAAANSLMTLVMEFITDEFQPSGALVEKVDIIQLPYTGGHQSWSSVATDGINLTGGTKVLRIAVPSGGVNINWFEFVRNTVPKVSLSAPSFGATYRAPATITMNASASDADGSISKVEFYNGTSLLGTDNAAPYSFPWTGVPGGSYSLTAKAFDNFNQSTKSSAVTVTVAPSPPGTAQWFIESTSGMPGDTVTSSVWFAGDGATTDTQLSIIFDVGRLSLPVTSGPIPGAEQFVGGYCNRAAFNQLNLLWVNSDSVLPSGWTKVCQITYTIPSDAPAGIANLFAVEPVCAAPSGEQPCATYSGQITVQSSSGGGGQQQQEMTENASVIALLSPDPDSPTPEMVSAVDYSRAEPPYLISAFALSLPLRVRPLSPIRPQGAYRIFVTENPRTASGVLERFIVLDYSSQSQAEAAVLDLRNDPVIEAAYLAPNHEQDDAGATPSAADRKSVTNQYHLNTLKTPEAHRWNSGWALVGLIDSGLDTTHPLIESFQGSTYLGGNALAKYQFDFGQSPSPCGGPNPPCDFNVDERQPVPVPPNTPPSCVTPASDPACQGDPATAGSSCMVATELSGHGTHTFGLLAANRLNASDDDIQGTCLNCGVAAVRIAHTVCTRIGVEDFRAGSGIVSARIAPAVKLLVQTGSQVVNQSFGGGLPDGFCENGGNLGYAECQALKLAEENDVLLVASAGNDRTEIDFPASDERVVAVGGVDALGTLWDESPGSLTHCPNAKPTDLDNETECGSNYTNSPTKRRQEVVAPAKNVLSTFHRSVNWTIVPTDGRRLIVCGDTQLGGAADGIGLCTGTSMSAPMVSGILGVLRSINPLVPKGNPETTVDYGLRDVVRDTTDRALGGLPWSDRLGYGVPNAAAAAVRVLGTVRGDIVTNRVTPLFTIYSEDGKDFASLATPQAALALLRYSPAGYSTTTNPEAPLTPGYTKFVTELPSPGDPRANAYVLTTDAAPWQSPKPIPLYYLDRERAWPLGCTDGSPGCAFFHRDSLLMTSIAEVQTAVADGYAFRGRQGYVYPRCSPEPSCMPIGTQKLYRLCKAADDDCAMVLGEDQHSAYQAIGYTSFYPAGSAPGVVGYAYPNVDSIDQDGLIDGMEYVIGTSRTTADSDGDGVSDSIEFPQAGISSGDPCAGPNITCVRRPNAIFANSFE